MALKLVVEINLKRFPIYEQRKVQYSSQFREIVKNIRDNQIGFGKGTHEIFFGDME